MLRLIIKDYRAYKHVIFSQLVIIIVVLTFGLFFDRNGTLAVMMLIAYPMSLPTLLLLMDSSYESLMLSLPIGRLEYVLSKYVSNLFFAFSLVSLGLLYGYMINTYLIVDGVYLNQVFGIKGILLFAIPIIIVNSITYPIFFKFSKEKGSIVLIILFALILLGAILGLVYLEKTLSPKINYTGRDIYPVLSYYLEKHIKEIGVNKFIGRITIGTLLTLLSSIMLSLRILGKKNIGGA